MTESIPAKRNFTKLLNARWRSVNSLAAVGIDPDISKIPQEVWTKVSDRENASVGLDYFCMEVVKSTSELVCGYKIQPAFFTSLGEAGERSLKNVLEFILRQYPDIPIIMDGKFSDISNTIAQYVRKVFDYLKADAVLVNPLMGSETVLPFAERTNKGVFVLCKTSNSSATEVLDLRTESGKPVWKHLVELALEKWNANGNIGVVLSANAPKDLIGIRQVIGEAPILLAGVGAQGGNLAESLPHLIDRSGYGFFVPSSRGVIFAASNENEPFSLAVERAARKLRDEINELVGR